MSKNKNKSFVKLGLESLTKFVTKIYVNQMASAERLAVGRGR